MGFLDILKGIGKVGLNVGAGMVPGGSLATSALKAGMGGASGALGAGVGAMSQSAANNRGEKFSGQLDLERLLMERDQQIQNQLLLREQDGRASGADAWKKLLSAQHTLNPSAMPSVSPYAVARPGPTDATKQGAEALTAEVMTRLQGGNALPMPTQRPVTSNDEAFRVDPKLLDAGKGEKAGGWLSLLLGGLGAAAQARTPTSAKPTGPGMVDPRVFSQVRF